LTGTQRIARRIRKKKQERSSYYVYMLLCDDGSYYTGYTNSLASRFERHEKGYGARYTKIRKPKKIVYVQRFVTRRAAMRKERQIKALSHDQKHDLAVKARPVSLELIGPRYRRSKPFRVM